MTNISVDTALMKHNDAGLVTATCVSGRFAPSVLTRAWLMSEGENMLTRQGIERARYDVQAILQAVLGVNTIDLYIDRERSVTQSEYDRCMAFITRRGRREPLQYILGEVDFCGLSFFVSPGVFIPRPETELIIEAISSRAILPRSILDLCTGSGALAISLATRFPEALATAIDCSEIALDVARSNQKRHDTHVSFLKGDLFGPLQQDQFDLIVCNPPYISINDCDKIDREVLEYEPHLALFSQDEGHRHLAQILMKAPEFLQKNGYLFLEIGIGQSSWLLDFVKEATPFSAQCIKDWAGIDRIAVCQWIKS